MFCIKAGFEISDNTSPCQAHPIGFPPPSLAAIMSCSLCKDISFLPLRETKFAFRNDANEALRAEYADRLFYFHHCCLPCVLKASQQGCQLCTLIHACLRLFNINGSSEDGLCAVLDLPDAGVWVILTQYRGKHSKVSQSIDGQTFVSITGDTNWSGHFTIHYGRFSATMDLSSLPR